MVDWKLGPGPADLDHRLALLELGSLERPGLHRPARDHDLGRHVEAAAMDAGDSLRRGCVSPPELCRRRLRVPPDDRLGPGHQAGTGLRGGGLSPGAERERVDARPSRRVRLQPVPQVREHQRGAVRPAPMVGQRSPAPAARPPLQLRPEERGLQPAGLRRPADDQCRADRAAAIDPGAAGATRRM